jgi:eukaryotic-like serine/threonine-protein kinase
VANGVAYVGSKDDNVYAVNVAAGKQVWKSPVGSVTAPPQVVGDLVYVATTTGDFSALKVADGTVAWHVKTSVPASLKPTWAADGGTVILSSYSGPPQAYDAATGNPTKALGSQFQILTVIAAAGGVLYGADAEGALHAIKIATAAPVWTAALTTSSSPAMGMAISDGTLYAATESGTLYSVNTANGHQNWKFDAGSEVLTVPTIADGKAYLSDIDGNLHAINAADGKQAWRATVTAGAFGPAAGGGQVYSCSSLVLQAFDAASGNPTWFFSPPKYGLPYATPAVANGTVVVGCSDGSLYAIRA